MIAVIPARGGSKGVPKKNIRLLVGKPLIAYTIEAAIKSSLFNKIIVSTDDERIAEVAKKYGAEVPFKRPESLSGDMATSDSVVRHAIMYYRDLGMEYDIVCKLQPTSPLRNEHHIREAYDLFKRKQADFVVSVCECEHSPLWTGELDDSLSMNNFMAGVDKNAGRQKLPVFYRLNGAIYMGKVSAFCDNGSFIGKNGYAYVMKQSESVDIDSNMDFCIAKMIMEGENAL